jgi:hypothetical protein
MLYLKRDLKGVKMQRNPWDQFIKDPENKAKLFLFINGVMIHKDISEINGMKYPNYSIEPNTCPNCKNEIECIEYCNYEVEHTKYKF